MIQAENWVEFPNVADRTDGQIIIGSTGLPVGLDQDRLQLNTHALTKGVIGWGNFETLTLSAYRGDSDRHMVGIGTDSSGNAYGVGAAVAEKADSSRLNSDTDRNQNAFGFRNGRLSIEWNINALNGRISTSDQYDPKIRARQLSREIRGQAIEGVVRHNIHDALKDKKSRTIFMSGFLDTQFLYDVVPLVLNGSTADIASLIALRVFFMEAMARPFFAWMGQTSYKEASIDPLLLTIRPTRAALGARVLATSRLVRATPAKKDA